MSEAREILAAATKARSRARWADDMRNTIRLGRPIKLGELEQRGPFGRKRTYLYELEDRMPKGAIEAIYEALGLVMNESSAEAQRLENRVRVEATDE